MVIEKIKYLIISWTLHAKKIHYNMYKNIKNYIFNLNNLLTIFSCTNY